MFNMSNFEQKETIKTFTAGSNVSKKGILMLLSKNEKIERRFLMATNNKQYLTNDWKIGSKQTKGKTEGRKANNCCIYDNEDRKFQLPAFDLYQTRTPFC